MDVADQLAIHDLYVRYTHAIDLGDPEGWADCFTSDGVLELPYRGQLTSGRDELVAVARRFHERGGGFDRHVTTNIRVTVDGDRAHGTAYLHMLAGGEGDTPPRLTMTGVYADELVRTADGWRFRRRVIAVDVRG